MSGSNIDSISITTAAPDTAFGIDSFSGTERLSRPFEYQAQLHSGQALLDPNTLLDNPATITLGDPSTKGRYINGIVAGVTQMPSQSTSLWRYSLRIVPKLWFLTQTSDCRFYHNMTVPDIVAAVLGKFSVTFENKLQASYTSREYTVMYNESYLNFIQRLMEDEGIFYFFTHEQGAHTMVLGDAASVFQPIANDQIELQDQGSHFLGLTTFQRADSTALGKVTVDDYNAETNPVSPGALRGEAPTVLKASGAPQRTHYAWPAVRGTTSDAGTRAKWRIEAAEAASQLYHGTGGSPDFIPGFTFTLTNDPIGVESYVIQSVSYSVTDQGAGSSRGGTSQISMSCTAFPASVTWREVPSTKPPVMSGLYTAIVIGAAGEEIYTDDYGRIQVQFPWDNAGDITASNTFWARVIQPWGGLGWGHQFTPRVGMEVLCGFLEGDVNRPVVVGSIYNNINTALYPAAKKNISGFRTRSTKGGGASNYNELSWDDTMGSELFFLHAEKDYYLEVENDQTLQIDNCRIVTVNKDETVTIKGKQTITVTGDQTIEVKEGDHKTTIDAGKHSTTVSKGDQENTITLGKQTVSVFGDRAVTVKTGNATMNVSLGSITYEAMQGITLKCGPSSVQITPEGITMSGLMVQITGQLSTQLSGAMTQVSGSAMTEISGGIVMIG